MEISVDDKKGILGDGFYFFQPDFRKSSRESIDSKHLSRLVLYLVDTVRYENDSAFGPIYGMLLIYLFGILCIFGESSF